MSNRYNDIHKEQIFEQASKALDDGAKAINTLRDLTVSGELPLIDYMEFMTALNETWQIRLKEGIKNKELELLRKGII
tara:strand:+ start:286 stop:519 length:234 start_codon:yes stop_codon:yes gene_type:complete